MSGRPEAKGLVQGSHTPLWAEGAHGNRIGNGTRAPGPARGERHGSFGRSSCGRRGPWGQVIHPLIGVLSLRIAFSDGGGEQADRGGAIAAIAEKLFGAVPLWLLGIALVGMAAWRPTEAALGQAGPDGWKASKRAMAAGRCVSFGFVAYSVLSYAAGEKGSGSGSLDKDAQDIKVLDWPAGQWIVGIAGAAVAGAGAQIAVRAVTHKFKKHLKMSDMSPKTRKVVNSLNFSEYRFV
ncbi:MULTISPECIES: DUF1206 domain-containing protein [unclassified Streptomyces]|uniref:DUF1206 domain-containing protein n=1 Tax=unclassified Streptomyces TaxID=2593676 RepID=UPI002E804677|nr:DUF1206 domain-containing protein [Streptomyces sp. NBC_00569]